VRASVKRNSLLLLVPLILAVSPGAAAQRADQVSPRIARLEAWLSAVAAHRPGAFDDSVRAVSTWTQEQLRLIWIDVSTIVSLIRAPSVSLFFISEPRPGSPSLRQVSPLATNRSTQVLYAAGELRRLRELANEISPEKTPGPENDILKRGAMLHADIEIMTPIATRPGSTATRAGPGASTVFMNDGQQLGFQESVSHWNMGRRLLERVRPVDSKSALNTAPDPGADETVRRWYLAGCAYMSRIRQIEPSHFARALELFPNDPDVLFFVAAAHEGLAGVRTQSVMQSAKVPRDVVFDVQSEGAELRRAEQLYNRALERNPQLVEVRIRLGRVLGLRDRHDEAVEQLRQGQSAPEPLLQFYAHLFLGAEFEALGNGAEARRSYERAAALHPTAQSPLLGLSRVADQAGDRAAARAAIERLLKLPPADVERADPWWVYEIAHTRAVDRLLAELRQRF
jgi:tetratricopeptide (TPR) repeat protein